MKINSIGTFTTATEFVPLFPQPIKEFKPVIYRQVNEDQETETKESVCGTSTQPESGITPQDQQATSQETEQAQP